MIGDIYLNPKTGEIQIQRDEEDILSFKDFTKIMLGIDLDKITISVPKFKYRDKVVCGSKNHNYGSGTIVSIQKVTPWPPNGVPLDVRPLYQYVIKLDNSGDIIHMYEQELEKICNAEHFIINN